MTAGAETVASASRASEGRGGARFFGRRRVSIRILVVLLIAALVTPAALLIGNIVTRDAADRQAQIERSGELLADEVADRLETEFRSSATLLAVFASSGWLEEGQYRLLHQRAQRALAGTQRYLIVIDENFEQILNTRVSFETRLGKTNNVEAAKKALEESGATVSNLFEGAVAGTTVYNVMRGVTLPDGNRRVLTLTRNADDLRTLFGQALELHDWSFAVIDGADQIAAVKSNPATGASDLPPECLEPTWGFRTSGQSGAEKYVFSSTVDRSPWRVCVWGAMDRLMQPAESYWALVLTSTIAWSLLALAAAVALSTALSRAVSQTARVGDALDAGQPVAVAHSFIAEVDDVRQALAKAAAERLRKDAEMRLMLRETAHRAKNQMALAISLINLSARSAGTVEELRDDVTNRLRAVGRSVDVLAARQSDTASLGLFVRAQLQPFVDDGTHGLSVDGDDLMLSPTAAQSLSLVLHELATNASKYGAWSVRDGRIEVRWDVGESMLTLRWTERGRGAGEPSSPGFGTRLIERLIRHDLHGSIERTLGEDGLRCVIVLPLDRIAAKPRTA